MSGDVNDACDLLAAELAHAVDLRGELGDMACVLAVEQLAELIKACVREVLDERERGQDCSRKEAPVV